MDPLHARLKLESCNTEMTVCVHSKGIQGNDGFIFYFNIFYFFILFFLQHLKTYCTYIFFLSLSKYKISYKMFRKYSPFTKHSITQITNKKNAFFILTINVFFSPTYYAEESHIQKILLFGLSREIHFEDKFMTTTTTILLLQKITINSPHCVTKHIPSIYLLYLLSNFLLTFIIFLSFLL